MIKEKTVKRIKGNIKENEYKKLIIFLNGDDCIKKTTRLNIQRTFTSYVLI